MPTEKLTARNVVKEMKEKSLPEKAESFSRFMQAYPGGYGEGDQFLGVVVPDQRAIAKKFQGLPLPQIAKLLSSPWHECRLTGVFILVKEYEDAAKRFRKSGDQTDTTAIVDFYVDHLAGVNNWDLVDSSAHKILGDWLLQNPGKRKILKRLAKSKVLWEQRVAVIATFALIREREFAELLELAERLLKHPHDLIHKAVGWMLREAGKRDGAVLRGFLNEFSNQMPRTMLRYAIEKLPDIERKSWLSRT